MFRLGKDEIILVEFSCIHQRKNSKFDEKKYHAFYYHEYYYI